MLAFSNSQEGGGLMCFPLRHVKPATKNASRASITHSEETAGSPLLHARSRIRSPLIDRG